jgi:hypothetical protein
MKTLITTTPLLLLLACSGKSEEAGETQATGQSQWRDAETGPDGAEKFSGKPEPQPSSDPMWVSIDFEGTGELDLGDPSCDLTGLGSFEGLYEGEGTIDDDGVYVASFAEAEATVQTPSGCEIPSLSVEVITDVVVTGYLSATQENCTSYCEASARAAAEERCAGDSDEVSCRAEVEGSYAASCETECVSTTHTIVAQSSLGVGSLADITASSLSGAALGTLSVDLTFDHIEDQDGDPVSEE